MKLPTDLSHEIADRVEPPDFDVVLTRARAARQRRRRTTIASGLAAACVVGGLAFAVGDPLGSDDDSPQPAPPGPTETNDGSSEVDPRLSDEVREILGGDVVDLQAISGSDGGTAALWRSCPEDGDCHLVLVTSSLNMPTAEMVTSTTLAAVPGGWLVLHGEEGWTRITPTGGIQAVLEPGGPGNSDVMAGDTAIETSEGWRLLRGSKIIPIPAPTDSDVLSAYVTPDGRLVVAASAGAGITLSATDDGRTWDSQLSTRTTVPVSTAVVSGNGDHVAVAFLGDDPDGSIPVLEVQVSHDAGATWEWARGLDVEGADAIRNLSSLAVSAEGSTYLTTESHGLIRIDADGNALASRLSSHDRSLFSTDKEVCLVAETGRVDELRCSVDDGTTWTPLSLPGFR